MKYLLLFVAFIGLFFTGYAQKISNQYSKPDGYTFLFSDSVSRVGCKKFVCEFSANSLIIPATLISAGIIIESLPAPAFLSKQKIQKSIQNHSNGFTTSIDDYLQYAPIAALYGLKITNLRSKSNTLNQTILLAKSELLMSAIVFSMKHFIHDTRPDGSADNSMPSGHTAQAFVSATMLDMEYRQVSPWISAGGYLMAATTGILRMVNNRHWAPDVLVGAGIGILSVRMVYATHQYRWGNSKIKNCVIIPSIGNRGGGVSLAMRF